MQQQHEIQSVNLGSADPLIAHGNLLRRFRVADLPRSGRGEISFVGLRLGLQLKQVHADINLHARPFVMPTNRPHISILALPRTEQESLHCEVVP